MLWYEFLALFFFLGSLCVGFCFLVFFEYKRNKEYVKMLHQRKEYYYWATQWYYRKEKEAEQYDR